MGLALSKDHESYVSGIATSRVFHDRQVKGNDPDANGYPGPPR